MTKPKSGRTLLSHPSTIVVAEPPCRLHGSCHLLSEVPTSLTPRVRPARLHRVLLWTAFAGGLSCSGGDGAGLDVPALRVTTSTTGVELDADGYTVAIDGGEGPLVGPNASIEIGSLDDGPHTLELLDVAPNCAVQGAHPRTVQTAGGSTADVTFDVECGPSTGAVRVITITDGEDQDEDGYVVVVNGEARQMDLNSSTTYENVPAGDAIAEILGVAANCSAATETYYQIAVAGGATTDVTFAFDCSPRQPEAGSIDVAVATSGPSPDPDGYTVTVDGGSPTAVPSSGTVLLTGLPVGIRTVALSGIAANCTVSGSNPRPVTVTGTGLAAASFAVVCTPPSPVTGTLRISTTTSGSDLDPTGYLIRIDGGTAQPIGINAVVSIAGLAAGSHSVVLEDMTPNCTTDENPRAVSIPQSGQTDLSFAVICTPATGTIATTAVTTGASIDPDGYIARVNGGAGKPILPNGTVTRAGLAPGAHTVQLDNIAANCQVQGDNPRAVVVAGNQTTPVTFEVICAASTGRLGVDVIGLPEGIAAQVTVTGPGSYTAVVPATAILDGLAPGGYTVSASDVTAGGVTYRPSAQQQVVNVVAGDTPTVTVSYSSDPGSDLNLRIEGLYITQATQSPEGAVPLIEDRAGYLRVFVTASGDNTAAPAVRVRFFHDGVLAQTLTLPAPSSSTATVRQEEPLSTSWNVNVPEGLIRRNLSILADVDPAGAVAESDESDNSYPLDGTPARIDVRSAPMFAVSVVPIQLGNGGLVGDASQGNLDRYLAGALSMHPLPGVDATLHAVYTSSWTPQQAGDVNAALSRALSELLMLRAAEGSGRYYYGVTHRNYSSGGIAGLGYLGRPAALGWDDPSEAGGTAAHEFGHNWNRQHTPCGGPSGTDPNYPYVGGTIGVYGFDLANERLIGPTTRDLMSYCRPRWISDYTYRGVMAFRASEGGLSATWEQDRRVQPAVVVWGRIENHRPILEPAFVIETRPLLPPKPGAYRLEGSDHAGGRVFSISFDASPVADGLGSDEHFAFAIPLGPSAAVELSHLRLQGPTGMAELTATAASRAEPAAPAEARRLGARVEVRWDRRSAPMAMLRDAATGEILALGRDGVLEVPTKATNLHVILSDGPSSRTMRFLAP